MGGEAEREEGKVLSFCNRSEEKSTTRFSPAGQAETEYATLRRLAVEAEPTLNESLVENGKVGGGQLRDLTTTELSRYKSNRVELIFVPAAG
jgi:hypothetical protein